MKVVICQVPRKEEYRRIVIKALTLLYVCCVQVSQHGSCFHDPRYSCHAQKLIEFCFIKILGAEITFDQLIKADFAFGFDKFQNLARFIFWALGPVRL